MIRLLIVAEKSLISKGLNMRITGENDKFIGFFRPYMPSETTNKFTYLTPHTFGGDKYPTEGQIKKHSLL